MRLQEQTENKSARHLDTNKYVNQMCQILPRLETEYNFPIASRKGK